MQSWLGPVFGEFFGTLVLIVFGDGDVAATALKGSKGEGAGWVHVNWGWAWAVVMGIFAAQATGSPQADINPAVTLAKFMAGTYAANEALVVMAAQFVGAFLGAVIVYFAYLNHWEGTAPDAQLAVFCTGPARRNYPCNFLTEVIATFFLVTGIMCIFSKGVGGQGGWMGAFMVGGLIYVLGAALGGPTGYSMNPARDFGPRVAHFVLPMAGKRDSDWGYAWVGTIGPWAGAAVAFFFCRALALM